MTWKDDMLFREYERFAAKDPVGELNRAILHEPEPASRDLTSEELANQVLTLSVRNAVMEAAAENWCNQARENFRLYKKWKSSLFVVAFWGLVGWVVVILK